MFLDDVTKLFVCCFRCFLLDAMEVVLLDFWRWIKALVISFVLVVDARHVFVKRNVVQLSEIFVEEFGVIDAIKMVDYGHYCGPGGRGTVTDQLDQCCKNHDDCWGRLADVCPLGSESGYFITYKYEILDRMKQMICHDGGSRCSTETCRCDRNLTRCFSKYQKSLGKETTPIPAVNDVIRE
ncbi:PLA2G2D (predicted) [Pycnogonum litorale]